MYTPTSPYSVYTPTLPYSVHTDITELQEAENYWIKIIQAAHFKTEIEHIVSKQPLSKSNSLLTLNPIVDNYNLLRVGGRRQLSATPYHSKHPLILHAKHKLTHLIIHSEHLRLLHAGPTLLNYSVHTDITTVYTPTSPYSVHTDNTIQCTHTNITIQCTHRHHHTVYTPTTPYSVHAKCNYI